MYTHGYLPISDPFRVGSGASVPDPLRRLTKWNFSQEAPLPNPSGLANTSNPKYSSRILTTSVGDPGPDPSGQGPRQRTAGHRSQVKPLRLRGAVSSAYGDDVGGNPDLDPSGSGNRPSQVNLLSNNASSAYKWPSCSGSVWDLCHLNPMWFLKTKTNDFHSLPTGLGQPFRAGRALSDHILTPSPTKIVASPRKLGLIELFSSKIGSLGDVNRGHRSALIFGILISLIAIAVWLITMVPAGGGAAGDGSTFRVPPRWGPGMVHNYPFRDYMSDLTMWILLTDLQEHQQVAAIILRLDGTARRMARTLTPIEITQGAMVNGIQLGPVAYLLHGLQRRYAPLDEEARLAAMLELSNFRRGNSERIDDLIARYETVRLRARTEGNFIMSIEGYALKLLRAVGVNNEALHRVLAPLGGHLPQTEAQFEEMTRYIKRTGHINEHAPDNIQNAIRGSSSDGHHFVGLANPSGLSSDSFADGLAHQAFHSTVPYMGHHGYQAISGTPAPSSDGSSQVPDLTNTNATTGAYLGDIANMEELSDTETDTSSDNGAPIDMSDVAHMNREQAGEHIFWQYARAKHKWRRFSGKTVRKSRRFVKKSFGNRDRTKGRGKGGRFARHYLTSEAGKAHVGVHLAKHGRSFRQGPSSGQGFGRRKNPKGPDGKIMTCTTCGSEDHFRARCPRNGSSGPAPSGAAPTFPAEITNAPAVPSAGPTTTAHTPANTGGLHLHVNDAPQGFMTSGMDLLANMYSQDVPPPPMPYHFAHDDPLSGLMHHVTPTASAVEMTHHFAEAQLADEEFWGVHLALWDDTPSQEDRPEEPTAGSAEPSGGVNLPVPSDPPQAFSPQGTDPLVTSDPWRAQAARIIRPNFLDADGNRITQQNMSRSPSDGTMASAASHQSAWVDYAPTGQNTPMPGATPAPSARNTPSPSDRASSQPATSVAGSAGQQAARQAAASVASSIQQVAAAAAAAAARPTGSWREENAAYAAMQAPIAPAYPLPASAFMQAAEGLQVATDTEQSEQYLVATLSQAMGSRPGPSQQSSSRDQRVASNLRSGLQMMEMFGPSGPLSPNAYSEWTTGNETRRPEASTATAEAWLSNNQNPPPSLFGNYQASDNRPITRTYAARPPPSGDGPSQLPEAGAGPSQLPENLLGVLIDPGSTTNLFGMGQGSTSENQINTLTAISNMRRLGQLNPIGRDNTRQVANPTASAVRDPTTPVFVPQAELPPVIFDGDDRVCTICTENFSEGERVIRVRCRHMFHASCWNDYCMRSRSRPGLVPDCPNCRGRGDVLASWPFLEPRPAPHVNLLDHSIIGAVIPSGPPDHAFNIATPSEAVVSSDLPNPMQVDMTQDDAESLIVLPDTWSDYADWDAALDLAKPSGSGQFSDRYPQSRRCSNGIRMPAAEGAGHAPVFQSNTQLADGRPSILVDPGSKGNLIGKVVANKIAGAGLYHNQKSGSQRRPRPLKVTGVGTGSQSCEYDTVMPVALTRTDGTSISGTFTAPCIGGDSELPALLGLTALLDNKAIIDFGTRQLHFVNNGTVKLDLPSGSSSFQLEHAPSGHLVLPCAEWEKIEEAQKKAKLDRYGESYQLFGTPTSSGSTPSGSSDEPNGTWSRPGGRMQRMGGP